MLWLYAMAEAGAVRDLLQGELARRQLLGSPEGRLGFGGEPRVVWHGELAAVVEELEYPPSAEPATLQTHDQVVRHLAERLPALLPARFGQTSEDHDFLARRLANDEDPMAEALARVRGCVQVTSRFLADEEVAPVAAAAGDGAEVSSIPDGLGIGRRYLRSRVARLHVDELGALKRHVEPWVLETRTRLGPKPVLASAYHLVPREKASSLVGSLRSFEPRPGLRIQVGEPAPVYAFTTLPLVAS